MTETAPEGKGREGTADSRGPEDHGTEPDHGERLHKFLASTGAGSRRECETFISQGRVSVNGKVVSRMGVKVDPARDAVMLDGERVKPQQLVYYLLHKPMGYICTNSDERGRPRVVDLIRKEERRIYTVGRLDAESTGLILLTNDGAIANVICHPRYRIEKRYQVIVRGHVSRNQITRVTAGVWLAEGKSSPARVKPVGFNPKRQETVLEMTLYEGRNREIRRVFAKVGLHVRRLRRTRIGPLELGDAAPGSYRPLGASELAFVHEAERMYLANKEAWDAELPPEETKRRPLREGGGRDRTGRPDRRGGGGPREGGGARGGARGGASHGGTRRGTRGRQSGGAGGGGGGGGGGRREGLPQRGRRQTGGGGARGGAGGGTRGSSRGGATGPSGGRGGQPERRRRRPYGG